MDNAVKEARKVTWTGFWCNAALGSAKIAAGVAGRSGAVVADGVHSFSDFLTDLIVLVMVTVGRKGESDRYEYGHGKYETFGTLLVVVALIIAGVILFVEGVKSVIDIAGGNVPPRPAMITIAVCVISIVVKEWLYRYTVRVGRRIESQAVVANAWHHRSDAFSSVATLAGVAGAIFLGEGWRVLDPLAQIAVAIMIVAVGIRSARPAVFELLEVSLPAPERERIGEIISSTPGVKRFHHLRTRRNGMNRIIDVHLKVDPAMTVVAAHDIATEVERRIRAEWPSGAIVTTHIEPAAE